MDNKTKKKLKKNESRLLLLGIIVLTLLLGSLVTNKVLNNIYNGKIKVKNVSINRVIDKTKKDNTEENINQSDAYSTLDYKIKYMLETSDKSKISNRTAQVDVVLSDEDAKYVSFNIINAENITSEIINGGKTLRIIHKGVTTNEEYELNISLNVKNAPNNYTISPMVTVKEVTSESKEVVASPTSIQTTSISGVIVNKETNTKINNAEITLCKMENNLCVEKKTTYSNQDGTYTFSDLIKGIYKIYSQGEYDFESKTIEVADGNQTVNLSATIRQTFNPTITKYVKSVDVLENGTTKTYDFDKSQKVNIPIKGIDKVKLSVVYEFEIKNTSNTDGYVKVVKENIPDGMNLDANYSENKNWEELNGSYYNKSLSNELIKSKETKKLSIKLVTDEEVTGKNYLNSVSVKTETYHTIKYIIGNEEIRNITVVSGDKLEDLKYEKEGYKFEGWYTDSNLTKKYDFNSYVEKDIILYGKLKRTSEQKFIVTYKLDNNTVLDTREVNEFEYAPNLTASERDGYDFTGWHEANKTENFDFDTEITDDLTLFASYVPKKYSVNFYIINDEVSNEYIKVDSMTQKVEYDKYVSKPDTEPRRNYYNFLGWYEEGESNSFNFANTKITGETNLYAKYEIKKVTITFNDNGEETVLNNIEVGTDISNRVITPNIPEGKEFLGWFKQTDSGFENNTTDFSKPVIALEDVTYVARYVNKAYTVDFYRKNPVNDELIKMNTSEMKIEEGQKISTIPFSTTIYGYVFEGWYSDEELTQKFDVSNEAITKNTVLYAKYSEDTVTIKFIDGENVNESTVQVGTIVNITYPEKVNGKNFEGWFKQKEDGTLEEEKTTFNGDILTAVDDATYVARYSDVKFTVDFYKIEGPDKELVKMNNNDILVTEGSKITETPNTNLDHYTFEGWYKDKELTEKFDITEEVVTSNAVLYAKYSEINVTITFIDGETNTELTLLEGSIIDPTTIPSVDVPEGKNFDGWYMLTSNGTPELNPTDFESTPVVAMEDMTFVAKYSDITFKLEFVDEDGNTIKTIDNFVWGTTISQDDIPKAPEKNGYTFTGWVDEKGKVVNFSKPIKEAITIKPTFTKLANGVTFVERTGEPTSVEVTYGETTTAITPKEVEGYDFSYWSTVSESEEGEHPEFDFTTPIEGIITLYAIYTPKTYEVVFMNQISSSEYEQYGEKLTVNYNSQISKPTTDPTRTGCSFLYWSTDKQNEFDFENNKITKNTTLYAVYAKVQYKLTINPNGGLYNESTSNTYFDLMYEETSETISDPTRENYTFIGWTSSVENVYNSETKQVTMPASNVTLTANWSAIKHNVTFMNEISEGEYSEFTETPIETDSEGHVVYPENTPSRPGYGFRWWSLEENGEEFDNTTLVTEDITLYAVYGDIVYTYTLDPNGGIIDGSSDVRVYSNLKPGETAGPLIVPTREYYTFTGWTIEGTPGESYTDEETGIQYLTMGEESFKYTANWNRIRYNIYVYSYEIQSNYISNYTINAGDVIDSNPSATIDYVSNISDKTKEFKYFTTNLNDSVRNKIDISTYPTYVPEGNTTLYAVYAIKQYEVKFFDGENQYENTKIVNHGMTVQSPSQNPTSGGDFFYWSTVSETEEGDHPKYDFSSPITSNLSLYAIYYKDEVTVSFSDVDSEGTYSIDDDKKQTVARHSSISEPEHNGLEGYTFKHWSMDNPADAVLSKPVDLIPTNNYAMVRDEKTGLITNNNQKVSSSNASSYFTVDTSKHPEITELKFVLGVSSESYSYDYGYVLVNESPDAPSDFANAPIRIGGTNVSINIYTLPLIENTLNYIHIGYRKDGGGDSGTDTFTVYQIYLSDNTPYTIKRTMSESTTPYDFATSDVEYDTTLYAIYDVNKYNVKYEVDGELYESAEVNYGEKASEKNAPNKDYYKFEGWYYNDELFDFDSLITENIILNAKYSKVTTPVISISPTDWTNDKVTVTITSSEESNIQYKIGNNSYQDYEEPFEVDSNSVITARNIINNIYSAEVTEEIENIDKTLPVINKTVSSILNNSFKITTKLTDTISGLGYIKIYLDDSEKPVVNEIINDNPLSLTMQHKISDLDPDKTYNVKIEVGDSAENVTTETVEVTTLDSEFIAASVTSRNGETLASPENYSTVQDAIDSCENKCTILLENTVSETIDVLEGQEITFDLNGNSITGVKDYGISNSGILNIIDTNEYGDSENYSTISGSTTAVVNSSTGTLILGTNDDTVDTNSPKLISTIGVDSHGIFKYYDGVIAGGNRIMNVDRIDDIPEDYSLMSTTISGTQAVYLGNLDEPEARINNVKYEKLGAAFNSAVDGDTITVLKNIDSTESINNYDRTLILDLNGNSVESDNILFNAGNLTITDTTLNDSIDSDDDYIHYVDLSKSNTDSLSDYTFTYDNGVLINTNKNTNNTYENGISTNQAMGYSEIDLSDLEGEYTVTMNVTISTFSSGDPVYAYISESPEKKWYETLMMELNEAEINPSDFFIINNYSGILNATNYMKTITGGKKYYLHYLYMKRVPVVAYTSGSNDQLNDQVIINSIYYKKSHEPATESYEQSVTNYGSLKLLSVDATKTITNSGSSSMKVIDSTMSTTVNVNDTATMEVDGSDITNVYLNAYAKLTQNSGNINNVYVRNVSTFNLYGGQVQSIEANNSSRANINIYGGYVSSTLNNRYSGSTVNLYNGLIYNLYMQGNSSNQKAYFNMYGGLIYSYYYMYQYVDTKITKGIIGYTSGDDGTDSIIDIDNLTVNGSSYFYGNIIKINNSKFKYSGGIYFYPNNSNSTVDVDNINAKVLWLYGTSKYYKIMNSNIISTGTYAIYASGSISNLSIENTEATTANSNSYVAYISSSIGKFTIKDSKLNSYNGSSGYAIYLSSNPINLDVKDSTLNAYTPIYSSYYNTISLNNTNIKSINNGITTGGDAKVTVKKCNFSGWVSQSGQGPTTMNAYAINSQGTVTVEDTIINGYTNVGIYNKPYSSSGKTTIKNTEIIAPGGNQGIEVYGNADIDGVTIENYGYGIKAYDYSYNSNPTVNINNTNITSSGPSILNQNCIINIGVDDGTINNEFKISSKSPVFTYANTNSNTKFNWYDGILSMEEHQNVKVDKMAKGAHIEYEEPSDGVKEAYLSTKKVYYYEVNGEKYSSIEDALNSIGDENPVYKIDFENNFYPGTSSAYSFNYEDGKLVSNNAGTLIGWNNSNYMNQSIGYSIIDLSEKEGKYNVMINAELSGYSSFYGKIKITDSPDDIMYETDNSNNLFYGYGVISANNYRTVLEGGKKYYVHYTYARVSTPYNVSDYHDDRLTINSVTYQAAFTDDMSETTIKLIDDVNNIEKALIFENEKVTFDLNGHTFNNSATPLFTNEGILTITDTAETKGSITSNEQLVNNSPSGTLNINNVKIVGSNDQLIYNNGSINIKDLNKEGGTASIYSAKSGETIPEINVEDSLVTKITAQDTNLTMKDSTYVTIAATNSISELLNITNSGTATITNTGENSSMTIDGADISSGSINNSGILEISNSHIENTNNTIVNSGVATINNGIYKNNSYADTIQNSGTLTINSGEMEYEEETVPTTISNSQARGIYNSGTLIIGSLSDNINTSNPVISGKTIGIYNTGYLYMYDGKVMGTENNSIYGSVTVTPQGYGVVPTVEDEIETSILSKIDMITNETTGKGYETLNDAVLEVEDEDVLRLNANYGITTPVVVQNSKLFTIKLNGYQLSGLVDKAIVNNNSTINITTGVDDKTSNIFQIDGTMFENNGNIEISKVNIINANKETMFINNKSLIVSDVSIDQKLSAATYMFENIEGSTTSIDNITFVNIYKLINNIGTTTISNFTLNKNLNLDKIILNTSGILNLKNVTYTRTTTSYPYVDKSITLIENLSGATLNITKSKFTTSYTSTIGTGPWPPKSYYTFYNEGILNISDNSEITDIKSTGVTYGYAIYNKNKVSIDNSKIYSTQMKDSIIYNENADSNLSIANCEIKIDSAKFIENNGTATIEDSTYSYNSNSRKTSTFAANNGTMTIKNTDVYAGSINNSGELKLEGTGSYDLNGDIRSTGTVIFDGPTLLTHRILGGDVKVISGTVEGGLYAKNITVTGGTVGSLYFSGTKDDSIIIGTDDGIIESTPTINGDVDSGSGKLEFYDGTITSTTENPISSAITKIADGSDIIYNKSGSNYIITLGEPEIKFKVNNDIYTSFDELMNDIAARGVTVNVEGPTDKTTIYTAKNWKVPSGKSFTLNLNNYNIVSLSADGLLLNNGSTTLAGASTDSSTYYITSTGNTVISNNSTLVVKNVSVKHIKTNGYLVYNNGRLSLQNSKLIGSKTRISNTSNMTVANSTIEGTVIGDSNNYVGKVIVNSGTVATVQYVKDFQISNGNVTNVTAETATIRGGEVSIVAATNTNITKGKITQMYAGEGNVTISGGEIFNVYTADSVVINGGAINVVDSYNNYKVENLTINSGEIQYSACARNVEMNSGSINGTLTCVNCNVKTGTIKKLVGTNVILGENDDVVSNTSPEIKDGLSANTKLEFYDGVIYGNYSIGKFNLITPDGYFINTTTNDDNINVTSLIETEEKIRVVLSGYNHGYYYSDLNEASDVDFEIPSNTSTEASIYLLSDVTLEDDFTIQSDGLHSLYIYYNGYHINKNGYKFIFDKRIYEYDKPEDQESMIEPTTTDNVMGTIRALLNIKETKDISKDIVIYETDDGNSLKSTNTYTLELLVNGNYEKVDVEEVLDDAGRYNISSKESNDTITTVNGKVYINNISNGSYRLISNDGAVSTFVVTDDGQVTGTAKVNYSKQNDEILLASTAQIITNIQTGKTTLKYGLIISLIGLVITGLLLLNKKRRIS